MHQRNPDHYLNLPDRLYRVTMQSSDGTYPANNRGGGTFSTLQRALNRVLSLQEQGYKARLFTTIPYWQELDIQAILEKLDDEGDKHATDHT